MKSTLNKQANIICTKYSINSMTFWLSVLFSLLALLSMNGPLETNSNIAEIVSWGLNLDSDMHKSS